MRKKNKNKQFSRFLALSQRMHFSFLGVPLGGETLVGISWNGKTGKVWYNNGLKEIL